MTVSILCLRAKSTVLRTTPLVSLSAPSTNMPWDLIPASCSVLTAKTMSSTLCDLAYASRVLWLMDSRPR